MTLSLEPNLGLRRPLKKCVQAIDTDYVLFLEHDWELQQFIDISSIIHTFDKYPNINYIRLNQGKRESRNNRLYVETNKSEIPLTKTTTFSNRPYFARRDALENWLTFARFDQYLLKTYKDTKTIHSPGRIINLFQNPQRLENVEWTISRYAYCRILYEGFHSAHNDLGFYIYGNLDDEAQVRHIDEIGGY